MESLPLWRVLALVALLLATMTARAAAEDTATGSGSTSSAKPKAKSCKGLWRPDQLVGKCFGLSDSDKLDGDSKEFRRAISTADDCRKLCCVMGDKCTSWQFQNEAKVCQVGPVVRFGLEGCDSKVLGGEHCGNWCDDHSPSKWNGKKVVSRDKATGECVWGESLPSQCFGYGPERYKNAETKERHDTDSCAVACCKDPECDSWQEVPGRGCFYGKGNFCEKYLGTYDGGRKCIKGHCGGKESEILEPWLKKHEEKAKAE